MQKKEAVMIQVEKNVVNKLIKFKEVGDTYSAIINNLIIFYNDNHTGKEGETT